MGVITAVNQLSPEHLHVHLKLGREAALEKSAAVCFVTDWPLLPGASQQLPAGAEGAALLQSHCLGPGSPHGIVRTPGACDGNGEGEHLAASISPVPGRGQRWGGHAMLSHWIN